MNMETLQNFNHVLIELMECCDTYVMQDKLEEILEKPKTIFGENIKVSFRMLYKLNLPAVLDQRTC